MATVKFRLDTPKNKDGSEKKEPVSLRVCVYISKQRRPEVSTGIAIKPKHWNQDSQSVKGAAIGHADINLRIQEIKTDLLKIWQANINVDTESLKRLLSEYFKGKDFDVKTEKKSEHPLISYINKYINDCTGENEEGQILINMSPNTVSCYRQTNNLLLSFALYSKMVLTFEAIDLNFYKSFTAYLWDVEKQSDNTVGKHIKNVKKFMNASSADDELHNSIAHNKKNFKVLKVETDEVYLNEAEILKIYSLDLSADPRLSQRRDLFVFACWAGVRFGDLCKIRPSQVTQHSSGKLLRVHTGKTSTDVTIPFHPLCEAIYSQYNNALPVIEERENSSFNEDLKTIADKAGLISTCRSRRTVRGKATFQYLKKCEMVSIHTARRSFATNCYKMGVPIITIMSITGHKTEKAFLRYVRITADEHAKIMMKFFYDNPVMATLKDQAA